MRTDKLYLRKTLHMKLSEPLINQLQDETVKTKKYLELFPRSLLTGSRTKNPESNLNLFF